ncbi:HEAT repeat domain-containing protein [Marinivivus vitaminiproducens]|uniref:HEAT repeat domain-containing protein n=1 Tax=Marinivivus vitaminiproducens TaxID=3035935 RepID=UPI002799B9CF|nr:HEAT repeat domain-containing protein [Geminicoccaceae bacterium SCSIO 64248]
MTIRSARFATCLHFGWLAASLSAAKALLYTSGTAVLLARTGVETMPVFYVLLAAVAVLVSVGFSGVVDRIEPMRLFQSTLLIILALTGLLRLATALDSPITHFAALASAHLYDMITDIVFWVAAARFLTSYDLKRATPWLYLGIAGGGAVGGLLAGLLSQVLAPEDLLLAVPPFVLAALVQLRVAGRRLEPVPDALQEEDDEEESYLDALKGLPELCRSNRLALLLAANGMLLTVVYSLSEYLCFVTYTDTFPDEAELTAFLGVVFALLQASEFVLLLLLSRVLVDRAGPILRNLIFPLSSLACLLLFAFGPRFAGAMLTHINTEAVSNAVFEPVNNTNYAALPHHVHGRVRTLADGILYPIGLALGGALLLLVEGDESMSAGFVIAILACLVFVGANAAIGWSFLPALVRHLRAGVDHFAERPVRNRGRLLERDPLSQVGSLMRSHDAAARHLALDLARDAPELVLPWIERTILSDDARFRVRLCRLVGRLGAQAEPAIERLLASSRPDHRRLGLELALACDRAPFDDAAAGDRAAELFHDVLRRDAAGLALEPAWLRARGAVIGGQGQGDVLRTLLHAPHGRFAGLVLAVAQDASVPALHLALSELRADARLASGATARALADHALAHPDARIRIAALDVLALVRSPGLADRLSASLLDGDAGVRRAAALALAGCGEAAVPALREALAADPSTARSAIDALGRIAGPASRATLIDALASDHGFAARSASWLGMLRDGEDDARWLPFTTALSDRIDRAIGRGLDVLEALGERRLVGHLRAALRADDVRSRADALEALVSLPNRAVLRPLLPLLERRVAAPGKGGLAARSPEDVARVLSEAALDDDPWLAAAARRTAAMLEIASHPTAAASAVILPLRSTPSAPESVMDELLALKRTSYLADLSLDTLLQLRQAAEPIRCEAGQAVPIGPGRPVFILIEGSVEVGEGGRAPLLLGDEGSFGEAGLIDDTAPPLTAVARSRSRLLRLHEVTLRDLTRDCPEIWPALCRLVVRRLRSDVRPSVDLAAA